MRRAADVLARNADPEAERTSEEPGPDAQVAHVDDLLAGFYVKEDGRADPVKGVRQFTVGTGGADLTGIVRVAPNSEVRLTGQFGVMHFTLQPAAMRWEFVQANGTIADSGLDTCR